MLKVALLVLIIQTSNAAVVQRIVICKFQIHLWAILYITTIDSFNQQSFVKDQRLNSRNFQALQTHPMHVMYSSVNSNLYFNLFYFILFSHAFSNNVHSIKNIFYCTHAEGPMGGSEWAKMDEKYERARNDVRRHKDLTRAVWFKFLCACETSDGGWDGNEEEEWEMCRRWF